MADDVKQWLEAKQDRTIYLAAKHFNISIQQTMALYKKASESAYESL